MNWLVLFIAGLFEIVWAVGLKYSDNFSKTVSSIITIVAMILSFWCLSYSLKTLPLGTSYAVWTGIGTIGAVLFGMLWLGDPVSLTRIFFISLILVGILGLKLTTA